MKEKVLKGLTGIGLIAGSAAATTTAINITALMQPVLDLMDFLPEVINRLPNILIPLAIVIVVVGAVIAVGAIFTGIVMIVVSMAKSIGHKL